MGDIDKKEAISILKLLNAIINYASYGYNAKTANEIIDLAIKALQESEDN